MASDVKWIKLTVDFFDDEKILLIESMPNGHIIIIVWVKLLCLAGRQNNSGVFKLKNGTPYNVKMLATIFRLDEEIVSLALNTFESFGMIQIINDVITLSNWGKHQNLDKIEAYNKYQRDYMRDYRKKQKAIATGEEQSKLNSKPKGKTKINSSDKELNKDKDIDTDTDKNIDSDINTDTDTDSKNSSALDYTSVINSFHAICKSLPKVVKLTDDRKAAIETAVQVLDGVSFVQLFHKVENSDFLSGRVKDWHADFDWIMKPENIIKIQSGMYHGKQSKATADYSNQSRYENLKMEVD